jgi:carboxymethylenebutenolidase
VHAVIPLSLCCALLAAGVPGDRAAAAAAAASDSSNVRLTSAAGGTGAFVAWPPGREPAPAIVVAHEWWGLNTQIRSIATRLAREGYVVIVPDLYHGKVADDPELAHELMRGLDENKAVTDLEAAASWLRTQPRVGKQKIGVVGFCMGGRLSQLMGLHGTQVWAVVMFYGRPETDPATLAKLHAPLQAHFGAEDRGIGSDQTDALKAGLAKAGKAGEVYVYPGAGHAFMNDTRPSYHADAARLAWARTLQFFQKHLKG